MSFLPQSLGGGGGFVCRCICNFTRCTPVQRVISHCTPVQSVTDTRIQTMKVFKLLIKLFFLATIITMATLNNNATYDTIVGYLITF